jgi:hypothetical protein
MSTPLPDKMTNWIAATLGREQREAHHDVRQRLEQVETELTQLRKRIDRPQFGKKIRDKDFLLIAGTVLAHEKTLMKQDRLWILWQAVRNTTGLGLPAAEVGSYRGGSAYFLAAAYLSALGREIPLEVIDTFEGHPEEKLTSVDLPIHEAGKFSGTTFEEVVAYLSEFELLRVHKGEFSQVAPGLPEQMWGFVHVDVDLYQPVLDCLRYFMPRLPPGGVIVLDDYDAPKCPGIRRAAEEYLADADGVQAWNPHTEQLVLIKTA